MYLTDILTRCSDIHERMARLHRTLAQRFESSGNTARLWRELALEDETHADVLRRELRNFEEQDETGGFLPEYAPRIEYADHVLSELEDQAGTLATFDDATALVLALEQARIEDLYDDLTVQAPPAFKLICERIEAALSAQPAANVPGLPRHRRRRESRPGSG